MYHKPGLVPRQGAASAADTEDSHAMTWHLSSTEHQPKRVAGGESEKQPHLQYHYCGGRRCLKFVPFFSNTMLFCNRGCMQEVCSSSSKRRAHRMLFDTMQSIGIARAEPTEYCGAPLDVGRTPMPHAPQELFDLHVSQWAVLPPVTQPG